MERTPLRKRSKKRVKIMEVRRELVEKILEERPWCERCQKRVEFYGFKSTNVRSTVVHEKRLRSAGGSITDEDENTMFALCDQ